jgi:hypothetical protein
MKSKEEEVVQKTYKPIKPVEFTELKNSDKARYDAYRDGGRSHGGIDIYDEKGTDVKASLNGIVLRATTEGAHKTYGGLVVIDHTPEIRANQETGLPCYVYTLYAHLKDVSTALGKKVRQGDVIGTVGNTGNANKMKPHLHFATLRAKERLAWEATGAHTGVAPSPHSVDPIEFFNGFTLPKECFATLTSKERKILFEKGLSYKLEYNLGEKPRLAVLVGGKLACHLDVDNLNASVKLKYNPDKIEEGFWLSQ